jgi:hypothetical protein
LKKCFWYLMHWQWVKEWLQLAWNILLPDTITLMAGRVPVHAELLVCIPLQTVTTKRKLPFFSTRKPLCCPPLRLKSVRDGHLHFSLKHLHPIYDVLNAHHNSWGPSPQQDPTKSYSSHS